jgi:hypothetical protein
MTKATTTATEKSVSVELTALQRKTNAARAKAAKARARRDEWYQQTESLRAELTARRATHREEFSEEINAKPLPGTEADRLRAEIVKRQRGENPHQARLDEAQAEFTEASVALDRFKRERVHDRIAEVVADHPALVAELREVRKRELEVLNKMIERVDEVRAVVTDTPGLQRRPGMWGHDPRLYDWRQGVEEALESEVIPPCISPAAEARLERFARG